MTTDGVAALLSRLDRMDEERREARVENARALKELRDELRGLRETMDGRLTALELARAEDAGERRGRSGVRRLIVTAAGVAAAVSGAVWGLIDHL